MAATINCCKDCPNRAVGCHSICKKYITARAKRDKELEARRNKYLSDASRGQRVAKTIDKRLLKERRFKQGY